MLILLFVIRVNPYAGDGLRGCFENSSAPLDDHILVVVAISVALVV